MKPSPQRQRAEKDPATKMFESMGIEVEGVTPLPRQRAVRQIIMDRVKEWAIDYKAGKRKGRKTKNLDPHIVDSNKRADSKNQDNWGEELHELWIVIPHFDHRGGSSHRWEGRIKAFILSLLASEKKRWAEKVRGMKMERRQLFPKDELKREGFNDALSDVITLLGEKWGVI